MDRTRDTTVEVQETPQEGGPLSSQRVKAIVAIVVLVGAIGYLAVQASVEGRPWPPPILVTDLASGLYAATMVLAALTGRHALGTGAYVDLSMTDVAVFESDGALDSWPRLAIYEDSGGLFWLRDGSLHATNVIGGGFSSPAVSFEIPTDCGFRDYENM